MICMKTIIAALFITFSFSALALPVVCESTKMLDGRPVLRFKINDKKPYVDSNGHEWDLYVVGVTPAKGFRKVLRASGVVSKKEIGVTFLDKDFIVGSARVMSYARNGYYEGEAQMSGVGHNPKLAVTCAEN